MSIKFDFSQDPHINVHMITGEDGVTELQNLIDLWKYNYATKKHFSFCFHTEKLTMPSMSDLKDLADFIKEYKKLKYQYLQYSIIIISNNLIRKAIQMLFKLTKPMAKVYLVKDNTQAIKIYNLMQKHPKKPIFVDAYVKMTKGIDVVPP